MNFHPKKKFSKILNDGGENTVFRFTGSKTFVSDGQAVGNLLTYMQSTVTLNTKG